MASVLLTRDENERLFSYLGAKRVAKNVTVLRIYQYDQTGNWSHAHTGVATIEHDKVDSAFYIRLYDIDKMCQLFQQKLFVEMSFKQCTNTFSTLFGEDCVLGLAFADQCEAKTFKDCLIQILQEWMANKSQPISSNGVGTSFTAVPNLPQSKLQDIVTGPSAFTNTQTQLSIRKHKFGRSSNKPKKLGREAISQPFAFEHVQHLGYNKDSQQFDLSGLNDDMLKKFFEDGGLNNLIKSDDDKAFALKFIEENCGLKEFSKAMKKGPMRPAPAPPVTNFRQPSSEAQPNSQAWFHTQKPNVRPPPIPTSIPAFPRAAPPPLPPTHGLCSNGPSTNTGVPPPPPSTLAPPIPVAPPIPMARSGPPPPPAAEPVNFLSQIRSFNKEKLKNAEPDQSSAHNSIAVEGDKSELTASLSAALNNLLKSRRAHLSDDSDDSDSF